MKRKPIDKSQVEMPFVFPAVHIPAIRIPQPDGSLLIRPGKPEIVDPHVSVAQFARETGISMRYIEQLCEQGHLVHRRLTPKTGSKILIPRSELERYKSLHGEI